jgi:hypothetical protein
MRAMSSVSASLRNALRLVLHRELRANRQSQLISIKPTE